MPEIDLHQNQPDPAFILRQLDGLRTELVDLAFRLECRGQLDAADVAITTSARVGELHQQLISDRGNTHLLEGRPARKGRTKVNVQPKVQPL